MARVDMHCHSVASRLTKQEVRKALLFPECATEPEALYELAKRRGMDFVTITDHDTIDGALRLADRPDCFVSEELTARFRDEAREIHVLCFGSAFNAPALAFREACGGVGIGGSDDHGGIHVGLTYTQTPAAESPEQFLEHVRTGLASAGGEQGGRLKLAQATVAIGLRSLPGGLGHVAGALASHAPRVRPREAPAPAATAAAPLADAAGL